MPVDTVLHQSRWVISGRRPPIENGAVLVHGRAIWKVGRLREVAREAPAASVRIEHGQSALIPGLINAHTHLEWSCLGGRIPLPQNGFPAWLKALNRIRTSLPEAQLETAITAGRRLAEEGATVFCGNIGTTLVAAHRERSGAIAETAPGGSAAGFDGCRERTFFEILGFDQKDLSRVLPSHLLHAPAKGPSAPDATTLAAHACYSTSAELIRQAKAWTRQRNLPFSIHTAEHREELELLRTGTGFFRNFLESIGRWDPGWEIPATSPVGYLDRLGVLDRKTLLVHAVHMTDTDWDLVAKRGCTVCFCPRSNAAINVGRPDLPAALEHRIPIALGTDSLASNHDLNLFQEAAYVLDCYPQLAARRVFFMVTLEGASALGLTGLFGTLERGCSERFLSVSLPPSIRSDQLFETVIRQGASGKWQWTNGSTSRSPSAKSDF